MNGGAGLRFECFVATERTTGWEARRRSHVALRRLGRGDLVRPVVDDPTALDPGELGAEGLTGRGREDRLDRPVFLALEGPDLALPLDDEPDGDGLDATGRQPGADLPGDERAERVADDPVDDPPGLLGVDEVEVDPARMIEGLADGGLGDLREGDPTGGVDRQVDRLGHVPGDRFALAVEVGREVHRIGALGGLADRTELLATVGDDLVLGREVMVDIHAELALARVLREVADMAIGGEDRVARPEIAFDRLRLGGRFDDDKIGSHTFFEY